MAEKVIKYHSPSKFDHAPYQTQWLSLKDDEGEKLFIQVSPHEQEPHWIDVGEFLLLCFKNSLDNQNFIQDCFKRYENSTL